MSTLNYHHLRYFWAVAREGNLTRAAQRMNVSQSAVSAQVQSLEDALDHPLFERRGRALHLTEAGRIVLDRAEAIFAIGDELLGTLEKRPGAMRQVLRVGALATLSRNFQIGFLEPLLGRDDVEVVVRSGTFSHLLAELETHRLDVVLANTVPAREATTSWIAHTLADQQVSLIGPPRSATPPRPLELLLREEALVLPTRESSIRAGFDALVDRLGVQPRIAAEVDDMAMMRLVARQHGGLSVLPSIVVKDELESGALVEVLPLPGLRETFHAITLPRRFPNPLLKALLDAPSRLAPAPAAEEAR